MHQKGKKGFTLIELVIVIAILAILAGILIPVTSSFIKRANNQADIANARLLLLTTVIAFGTDETEINVYTAAEDGSSPTVYQKILGPYWPMSRIAQDYFIVDVDYTRTASDVIRVIRVVDGVNEIYQSNKGVFE